PPDGFRRAGQEIGYERGPKPDADPRDPRRAIDHGGRYVRAGHGAVDAIGLPCRPGDVSAARQGCLEDPQWLGAGAGAGALAPAECPAPQDPAWPLACPAPQDPAWPPEVPVEAAGAAVAAGASCDAQAASAAPAPS